MELRDPASIARKVAVMGSRVLTWMVAVRMLSTETNPAATSSRLSEPMETDVVLKDDKGQYKSCNNGKGKSFRGGG